MRPNGLYGFALVLLVAAVVESNDTAFAATRAEAATAIAGAEGVRILADVAAEDAEAAEEDAWHARDESEENFVEDCTEDPGCASFADGDDQLDLGAGHMTAASEWYTNADLDLKAANALFANAKYDLCITYAARSQAEFGDAYDQWNFAVTEYGKAEDHFDEVIDCGH